MGGEREEKRGREKRKEEKERKRGRGQGDTQCSWNLPACHPARAKLPLSAFRLFVHSAAGVLFALNVDSVTSDFIFFSLASSTRLLLLGRCCDVRCSPPRGMYV